MWTKEWPAEAGTYWVYGWPHGRYFGDVEAPPRMLMVNVANINGLMVYETEHGLINSGASCMWHPAMLPEPPNGTR